MRKHVQIVLLTCMLPGMLTGIGIDRVFCISPHGHMAVEPAMKCAEHAVLVEGSSPCRPGQESVSGCHMDCGACADIPGVCSDLQRRGGDGAASEIAAALPMLPFAVAQAREDAAVLPADTPVAEGPPSRCCILLI